MITIAVGLTIVATAIADDNGRLAVNGDGANSLPMVGNFWNKSHSRTICVELVLKSSIEIRVGRTLSRVGKSASAVLVPSTKTIHFSHAATALTKRTTFKPLAMYSDAWPANRISGAFFLVTACRAG